MNPRYKPFVWVGAAIAVGLVLVLITRGVGSGEPLQQSAQDAAGPSLQPASPGQAAPLDLPPPEPTPPWAQAAAGVSAAGVPSASVAAPGQLPALSAQDTNAAIASIRQQSQHNMTMADSLLKELDQLERSGNAPADMNVAALRTNLVIAKRAQVLALELAESTQQPESEARQRRTEAIVAELQSLQGKLRYDVGGAPAGGAIPARTQ